MVDKSDPSRGVFENVAKWHNTIECIPEWEEMLEFEYIRQRGEINMLHFDEVQRYAYDRGLYGCVTWMQRCRDAKIAYTQMYDVGLKAHVKDHGPRDSWITKELKKKFLKEEFSLKQDELKRQLRELERSCDEMDE